MGWRTVWRVRPTSEPVLEDAAEPEPAPNSAPVPAVDRELRDGACVIAQRVWSGVPQPRAYLLRWDPPGAGRYVDFAVSQQWLRVDGDTVSKGSVSPYPVERTMEVPRGSDQGWSLIDAWSRGVERLFSGLG